MSDLIEVKGADGGTAVVERVRYNQFDSVPMRAAIANILAMDSNHTARDAQEALSFLVSQLAYTEAMVFEKMYQPMQYEDLLPISNEAGEWADTIRYEIFDYSGRGRRTAGKGKDVNLVEVAYADKSLPVMLGDIGYDYTQEELRRTAFLRRPLNTVRLMAAIEAYKRHINDVALNGESASNVTGLFNNATVPQGNAPVGAWQTGPKTPDQIIADINNGIYTVWSNSGFNDLPNVCVMSPSAFSYVSTTPRASGSDKSILQWVKENNLAKVQKNIDVDFQPGYGLDTAGVGSTKRAIFYIKSPTRLVLHLPMVLRFLPPQAVGLSIEIPGEYKYSGVEVRYPKSMYYMDGI